MLESDGREPDSMRQAHASSCSFAHFDLQLSDAERAALRELTIGRTCTYDNFGNTPALEAETVHYFASLGTAPFIAVLVARIVSNVTNRAVSIFNAETAWVSLRASLPSSAFDIPRWHMDGYFFRPHSDQRKIVVTLRGATTLFSRLTGEWRHAFRECARCYQDAPMALRGREELATIVNASGGFETAGEMQGTIFVVGDCDRAAVHSEPMIHSERLFLSILPGSRAQIRELRERWGVDVRSKST
jgi:hypothetical protein